MFFLVFFFTKCLVFLKVFCHYRRFKSIIHSWCAVLNTGFGDLKDRLKKRVNILGQIQCIQCVCRHVSEVSMFVGMYVRYLCL